MWPGLGLESAFYLSILAKGCKHRAKWERCIDSTVLLEKQGLTLGCLLCWKCEALTSSMPSGRWSTAGTALWACCRSELSSSQNLKGRERRTPRSSRNVPWWKLCRHSTSLNIFRDPHGHLQVLPFKIAFPPFNFWLRVSSCHHQWLTGDTRHLEKKKKHCKYLFIVVKKNVLGNEVLIFSPTYFI